MENLPLYLFDKILEFNQPIDMIKCKLLNKEYKENIEKLFLNSNSFIQTKYSHKHRIDEFYTWIRMIKYQNSTFLKNNVYTYKIFLRNNPLKVQEFDLIFCNLRDMYDITKNFNIGIIFYEFFLHNLKIFKVNTYNLTELERYKQETYFYYLIDIYLNSKKGIFLNYLSEIFDEIFEYRFEILYSTKSKD